MISDEMKTEEGIELPDYELTFIVSPELNEDDFEATVDDVQRFITEREGSITDIDRWGKRKLAYPIKRFIEGSYVLMHFKLAPALGKELETSLKISEKVLRHLLIRQGD